MHYIYILYSAQHDKFYHGMTADLNQRLHQHNMGKVKSTKAFVPWTIIYFEEMESPEEARKREKFFKTASGRRFLKPVKDKIRMQDSYNPEVSGSPPDWTSFGRELPISLQRSPFWGFFHYTDALHLYSLFCPTRQVLSWDDSRSKPEASSAQYG